MTLCAIFAGRFSRERIAKRGAGGYHERKSVRAGRRGEQDQERSNHYETEQHLPEMPEHRHYPCAGQGRGHNIQLGWTNFSAVLVHRYVCGRCGYSEEWIDKEDLPALKEKFR